MAATGSLLAGHVSFRCTSVDRIAIRRHVPGLQYEGGVVKFLLNRASLCHRPAALNQAHDRRVAGLDAVVASSGVAGGALQEGRLQRGPAVLVAGPLVLLLRRRPMGTGVHSGVLARALRAVGRRLTRLSP
jgi:hypothetical protein